jgi:serine protease Do
MRPVSRSLRRVISRQSKAGLSYWFLSMAMSLLLAPVGVASQAIAEEPANTSPQLPTPDKLFAGQLLAPKAFRAAVDKVLPSLVTIETFGGLSGGSRRGKMQGISRPGDGPTTGVIISADGYVVTSTFNFLRRPPVITVVRQDGTRHVATLLGRDETRKLCVLKIEGVSDLPVPEFVSPSELKIGAWAISVGVGYGDDEPMISAGIVSALNRVSGRAVQTDANISPANYGGPLLDIEGRVIGICVPLNPMSKEVAGGVEWYDSGIGFAASLHGTENVLAAMKAGKTIQPGSLGVQVKPADANGSGAVIAQVLEKSGAEKAGLKPEDRLLAVAGEAVLDVAQLRTLVSRYAAGDEVKLTIRRGEEELQITVTLQIPPEPQPMPKPAAEAKPAEKKPAEKPAE